MKVIIEIPQKYLEIAKGLMLASCETEEQEKELTELVENAKNVEELTVLNPDLEFASDKQTAKQLYIGLACMFISECAKEKKWNTNASYYSWLGY